MGQNPTLRGTDAPGTAHPLSARTDVAQWTAAPRNLQVGLLLVGPMEDRTTTSRFALNCGRRPQTLHVGPDEIEAIDQSFCRMSAGFGAMW